MKGKQATLRGFKQIFGMNARKSPLIRSPPDKNSRGFGRNKEDSSLEVALKVKGNPHAKGPWTRPWGLLRSD